MINCVTSLTIALRQSCKELFKWIFDFYRDSTDDTRILLLKSIEGVIEVKFRGLQDNLPFLMLKLMKVLEVTDFGATLIMIQVTNVFVTFSRSYPSAFQKDFMEVIDIMIAWYLESAMNPLIISTVREAFLSFHSFWFGDLPTTEGLLSNFVEDVEDIDSILREDLKSSKNDESYRALMTKNLMKMASLVDVYVVVSRAVTLADEGDTIASADSWTFASESLKTILSATTHVISNIQLHDHLIIACNRCAIFTIEKYSDYGEEGIQVILELKDVLLAYVDLISPHLISGSIDFIVSTLKLQNNLVKSLGAANHLPVASVTKCLTINSSWQQLRSYPSQVVHRSLYQLHHSLVSLKSLPLLEETYKLLLVELQAALTICFNVKITLIDQCEMIPCKWTASQAKFVAKSIMLSLSELSTTTSSVIGMWALKPSFFDLMVVHLNPADKHFNENPDLQSMLMTLLTSHSKRHHHFISSSILFQASKPSTNSFVIEAPTSHHLSRILSHINLLLSHDDLTQEIRIVVLQWFMSILTECEDSNLEQLLQKQQTTSVIEKVVRLLISKDLVTVLQSGNIMDVVIRKSSSFQPGIIRNCKEACLFHLKNSLSPDVRSLCDKLFFALPLDSSMTTFSLIPLPASLQEGGREEQNQGNRKSIDAMDPSTIRTSQD
jgi:PI-3-kinase-related kinase SMG-1